MDIHKPKPWHNVREFLKEYVIIVIGVLTALAAEQGAEWLHWRHNVEQAETALRAETEENLLAAYRRGVVQPCISAAIADLRDRLAAPGSAWRASSQPTSGAARRLVMPMVAVAPTATWPTAAWETAVSSGALSHMPPERARLYARLYRRFQMLRDWQGVEQEMRPRLTALGFDRTLTEPEKAEYLNVLGELDQFSLRMADRRPIDDAAQGGLKLKTSIVAEELHHQHQVAGHEACAQDIPIPTAPG